MECDWAKGNRVSVDATTHFPFVLMSFISDGNWSVEPRKVGLLGNRNVAGSTNQILNLSTNPAYTGLHNTAPVYDTCPLMLRLPPPTDLMLHFISENRPTVPNLPKTIGCFI